MPSPIIDAKPCVKCGTPTLSIIEVVNKGESVIEGFMCETCRDRANVDLVCLKVKFLELLGSGLSRETANRAMIAWHIDEICGFR